MKKLWLVTFFFSLLFSIYATETEDFRFINGLYSDHNYDMAMGEIQNYIRTYPQGQYVAHAQFLLANIYMEQQKYDLAEGILRELYLNNRQPSFESDLLLTYGYLQYSKKNNQQAESILSELVTRYPNQVNNQKAYIMLGKLKTQEQQYDEAVRLLDQAARISYIPDMQVELLNAYIKTGKITKADSLIQYLNTNHPEDSTTQQVTLALLNYRYLQSDYSSMLAMKPVSLPNTSVWYADYQLLKATALYETAQYDSALSTMKSLPDSLAKKRFLIAQIYFKTNKIAEALPLFQALADSCKDNEIQANSFFYIIKNEADRDPEKANQMLLEYLQANPMQQWEGIIYYQIGFNDFKAKNYEKAMENLGKAIVFQLDEPYKEKTRYLLAEASFYSDKPTEALEMFNSFLQQYPNSPWYDEALFKSGIINYDQKVYTEASQDFQRLIDNYQDSDKYGMSCFYLGEISLALYDYNKAIDQFTKALNYRCDKDLATFRLAQLNYLIGEYGAANKNLDALSDSSGYAFDKLLLRGNICLSKKDLSNALKTFQQADKIATDPKAKEEVLTKIALTYYYQKKYKDAASVYSKLYQASSIPGKYLLAAANAAYSAEDYLYAQELYLQYSAQNQQSEELYRAQLGLANCFYNLGDFKNSAEYFRKAATTDTPIAMLEGALDGLFWCAEQDTSVHAYSYLKGKIAKARQGEYQAYFMLYKAKYEYNHNLLAEAVETITQLFQQYPDYQVNIEINVILAQARIKQNNFNAADKVFSKIAEKTTDAQIYYEWANLYIAQKDTLGAIKKLKIATQKSNRPDIWLQMLKYQVAVNDSNFIVDYNLYCGIASPELQEEAKLDYIQFNINRNVHSGLDSMYIALDKSQNQQTRAKAQYLLGLQKYNEGNYAEALRQFLRVRYVFTQFDDIRSDAEVLACITYQKMGQSEQANKLYQIIKNSLSQDKRKRVEKELNLG